MIKTCKILRVIAIRTYWAQQLIFWSKMGISAQYVRIVRIGHSFVLGSNMGGCVGCVCNNESIVLLVEILDVSYVHIYMIISGKI